VAWPHGSVVCIASAFIAADWLKGQRFPPGWTRAGCALLAAIYVGCLPESVLLQPETHASFGASLITFFHGVALVFSVIYLGYLFAKPGASSANVPLESSSAALLKVDTRLPPDSADE